MIGADRKPKLYEVINNAVASALRESARGLLPAKIVKWDAAKQRADCQILVKNVTTAEDESREVTSFPVVPGVPVQFLGAGGFRMTCPIYDGTDGEHASTTGSLIFASRSLDKWLSGTGQEVDPEFDHDHALADAVFFPGLMPFGAPLANVPTDMASFGSDSDGNGRVECKASEIDLGTGATKQVARKGDPVELGQCYVTMSVGVVNAVFINGVALPIGTDPGGNRGTVNGGSAHVKAVD